MTPDLNNHTAASHFLSEVLLSTMAVEGAEGSKAVEFEFGERMSHLRSVREAYEERKHFSFSGDWIKTHIQSHREWLLSVLEAEQVQTASVNGC